MKLLLVLLSMISTEVFAHGGEDHSAPVAGGGTVSPTTTGSMLKLVSYPGPLEVLVKYPAPELNKPVTGRIFFADQATNHPVDPAVIELTFPGALGAEITKPPKKISDGIYEFSALFIRDTGHTALLRVTTGGNEHLTTLSPFYAGTSAERALTATVATASASEKETRFSMWILLPLILLLVGLGIFLLRKRRERLAVVAAGTRSVTTVTESRTTDV